MTVSQKSPFLSLPSELRLEIYRLVELSGSITIGSVFSPFVDLPTNIPGLPRNHIPIVRTTFDKGLLKRSYLNQAEHFGSDTPKESPAGTCPPIEESNELVDTISSLRLTCRYIAAELAVPGRPETLKRKRQTVLDVYLSFPLGVCVAVHRYPHILGQARNVKVAGRHIFQEHDCERIRHPQRKQTHSWLDLDRLTDGPDTQPASSRPLDAAASLVAEQNRALSTLVWMLLGHTAPSPSPPPAQQPHADGASKPRTPPPLTIAKHTPHPPKRLNKLHVRVFFPGQQPHFQPHETYRAIWELPDSPVPLVLGAICGGDIVLSCARGRHAVGMEIVARDNGGRSRCVAGVWPSLGNDVGAWWVDELEVGTEGVNWARVKGVGDE